MKPTLPLCCAPGAFDLMRKQMSAVDTTDALLNGALAISIHGSGQDDHSNTEDTLHGYVQCVRRRFKGSHAQAILAHLHEFLFEEEGFVGNTDDYYHTSNSFVPAVLESKRGLPITLAVIYKVVGERLGLTIHGVGLPGHFVIAVQDGSTRMLVDPFNGGRVLTSDQAREVVHTIFGDGVEWSDEMLRPVTNRQWLTRMIQNLLQVYNSNNQFADVAAMLELEMLLWPEQLHLQRDLALVLARVNMPKPASAWLTEYLKNNPNDPQKSELEHWLEVLSA